jgi:hypothetical protein
MNQQRQPPWARYSLMTRLLVINLLIALVFVPSCKEEAPAKQQGGSVTELAEPENALTEALMVGLGQARNYHHKADLLVSEGKIDEAAEAVAKVLEIPFPADASESEDVILDTRARLAKLRVMQDRLDEAMILVDKGISLSTRGSFFLANLHTVRGEIFEARAKAAEPNSEEADAAKIDAIKSFDASIQINNALLEKLGSGQ